MTLIAAAGVDTYPAIFGDVLVSGPERPGGKPETPIDGEAANPSAAKPVWSILGPGQRIVVLSDNCVIAWSGDVDSARAVVGELRAMASQAPLSITIIDAYLSQLDPAVNDEINLVGWMRDNGVFHQFRYRADTAEGAMFGRISAGGSGATDFVKLASRISGGGVDVRGEAPTGLDRALSAMLSATSLLLQAELSNQGALLPPFSGGYEIATFIQDKFAKVGDIAFIYWSADVTEAEVKLTGPELIAKHDYAGELLLLQTLRVRRSEVQGDPDVVEGSKQVIPPFGGIADATQAADIVWPRMDASFTCHVVVVRSSQAPVVFNRIEYSTSRTPRSIRFSFGNDRTPFGVSQQFCQDLLQDVRLRLAAK
jgi:hypothetical protein